MPPSPKRPKKKANPPKRAKPRRPKFISGIFNYCDRWCERCPMTARCRLFADEQKAGLAPAERDIHNAAFWEGLAKIFAKTKRMMLKMAKAKGIDLNAADAVEETARRRTRQDLAAKTPAAAGAFAYAKAVSKWFDARKDQFAEKGRELIAAAEMELPGESPEAEAQELSDAVDVIRWYQFQIHVKPVRAYSGKEEEQDGETDMSFPSDADGSAKVALIGVDRSLAAWAVLRRRLPDDADSVLDMLVALDRIRRGAEASFPKARAFRRPGFDDAEG